MYLRLKYPVMKVSYVVAVGIVVLFVVLFALDYLRPPAGENKEPELNEAPVPTPADSLEPVHQGNIMKSGNSTRDVFKALAEGDTTDTVMKLRK